MLELKVVLAQQENCSNLYTYFTTTWYLWSRAAWKTSDFVVLCQNLQQIIVFLTAPRQTHGQKCKMSGI